VANEHARDPPWKWKVWDAAWPSLRGRGRGVGNVRGARTWYILYGSATAPSCTDCPGLASVSRGGWRYRLCSAASCRGMETPCLGCEGYAQQHGHRHLLLHPVVIIPVSSTEHEGFCSSGIITRSWGRGGGVWPYYRSVLERRRQPVAASQGRQASFSLGQGFLRIDFPLARAIPLLV
jgi:hypothetical protein